MDGTISTDTDSGLQVSEEPRTGWSQNEDVGNDVFACLHTDLEKLSERATSVVDQCAGRVKAVHEVALSQMQAVIQQLHSEHKAFLDQAANAIKESSWKCASAGTGEMGMEQDKVNRIPCKIYLPGQPVESDAMSREWLDKRLKERGVQIAHSSDVPRQSAVSFQISESALRACSNKRSVMHRSGITEDSLAEHEESCFSIRRKKSDATSLSPHMSPHISPRRNTRKELEFSTRDSSVSDEPRRVLSTSPAMRRQRAYKSIVEHTQGILDKSHALERSRTCVNEDTDALELPTLYLAGDMLKDQVRSALLKHRYDVREQYSKTGVAQHVAKSNLFELFTICVVMMNAVWIAIALDMNDKDVLSDSDAIFQIAEHAFCAYFTFELFVRFAAFRTTRLALQDTWFVFDSVLVTLMVIETWLFAILLAFGHSGGGGSVGGVNPDVLKLLKLLRLTRMARMARLLRWMPELMILLKGLWLASKSVFFTLVLLVLTVYIFALVFRQITDETPIGQEYFPSVSAAFWVLLMKGTLPDLAEWVNQIADENVGYAILLMLFILFATLTVMNMLVGVLVEVVANVSTMENETMMVNMVRAKMLLMIEKLDLDRDGNGTLSKNEFEQLLILPEAAQFMQSVGVDVVGLVEFSDFIFKEKELTFPDFVELVLQLRGSNQATVKDIVDMRKQMTSEFENITFHFSSLSHDFNKILEREEQSQKEIGYVTENIHRIHKAVRRLPNAALNSAAPNAPQLTDKKSPEPEPPTANPPSLYDDSTWSADQQRRQSKLIALQKEEVPQAQWAETSDTKRAEQESLNVYRMASLGAVNEGERTPLVSSEHNGHLPSTRPFGAKKVQMTVDEKALLDQRLEKEHTSLRHALDSFHRFDYDYEEEV